MAVTVKGTVGSLPLIARHPRDLRQEGRNKTLLRTRHRRSGQHSAVGSRLMGNPARDESAARAHCYSEREDRVHRRLGDDHYNPSHALFRSQEQALKRPLEHLTAASVSPGRHSHGTRHGSLTQLRLPSKPDSFDKAAATARTRGKPYMATHLSRHAVP